MKNISLMAFIGLGGAAGALMRYWIAEIIYKHYNTIFPLGTLLANLIGCFMIGVVWNIFGSYVVSSHTKMFVSVGFLGALTTFSTYALGTTNLILDGMIWQAMLNIILNNVLGVGLVFAGFFLSQVTINAFN